MSISGINGIVRVSTSTADTSAPAMPPSGTSTAAPPVEIDPATQQPLPPRFPWLSRLEQQLEASAKQRSAFAPAPILGDNLDQSA